MWVDEAKIIKFRTFEKLWGGCEVTNWSRLAQTMTKILFVYSIPGKEIETKLTNRVGLSRSRRTWYLLLRTFWLLLSSFIFEDKTGHKAISPSIFENFLILHDILRS